jgi:6-pyruvoyltetrahydropterin/6-carboxytetrahydropterin synthase
MRITREFRFFLRSSGLGNACANPWSGWGGGLEVAPWLALRLTITGPVDPVTGYLCDIRELDRAMREAIDAFLAAGGNGLPRYDGLLAGIRGQLPGRLPDGVEPVQIALVVSPCLSLAIDQKEPAMVQWTQQFEFSAAHRLHCAELSDDENRQLFGKCNNPAGHGHNYVVEVTGKFSGGKRGAEPFSPPEFEREVRRLVIDRLDHKHLNMDIAEFKGRNPSVENIATTIWSWLDRKLPGLELVKVRVYETPKTWAEVGEEGRER